MENPQIAIKKEESPRKIDESSKKIADAPKKIDVGHAQENIKTKKIEKEKTQKRTQHEQIKVFSNFINKAGIETSFGEINKKFAYISIVSVIIASLYLLWNFIVKKTFFLDAVSLFFFADLIIAICVYIILWVGFFIFVDYSIYKRRKEIEAVFPDFLQLTAANINSGMPIDRALWFAIRPKFGILAKEMEHVAKATMVGENLNSALMDFSNKYDSITVKRALNLLVVGLESGGEVGELLTKVSENIRETEILKKEMASSVTTYVIFILFATLGAAPFLFGLTTELIIIMTSIMSKVSVGSDSSSLGSFGSMLGGGNSISITDYQIFAVTSVCVSSMFAAIIISVIQKGDAKEALKKIPLFALVGIINYFIVFKAMNWLLGGFFG